MVIIPLLATGVALGIVLPASIGAMAIAMGFKISSLNAEPELDVNLAITSGIGLAILAAALSGIVTWLGRVRYNAQSKNIKNSGEESSMRTLGLLFLLAALFFTLFAIFTPLLPYIKDRTDTWSIAIKYTYVITLIGGAMILSSATIWGICQALYSLAKYNGSTKAIKTSEKKDES